MVLSFNSHIWIPFLLFLSSLMVTVQGDEDKGIQPRQQNIRDKGYDRCMAGWYDVQGQGVKNDYCRWVGNCGCKGQCSWWSCALAGKKDEHTAKGKYSQPEEGGNCYYDYPRLLPHFKGSRPNMVPEVCNDICRSSEDTLEMYSYFGVQYHSECWCGHQAPHPSRKMDPENCDTMCKGDEKLRCGGGWKANIWKVCTDENCEFKYD